MQLNRPKLNGDSINLRRFARFGLLSPRTTVGGEQINLCAAPEHCANHLLHVDRTALSPKDRHARIRSDISDAHQAGSLHICVGTIFTSGALSESKSKSLSRRKLAWSSNRDSIVLRACVANRFRRAASFSNRCSAFFNASGSW